MPEFIVLPEPEGKKLDLDDFTRGYLECAVWLSDEYVEGQDNPNEAESGRWSLADIETESLDEAIRECKDFQEANASNLKVAELDRPMSHLGHDFFLSRNGHGTGFWDRGLGEVGEALHAAAKVYDTWELEIVGDHLVAHG